MHTQCNDPDIKIFVSHRIDVQSELIDNPLYVPVRCGAIFDRENPTGLLGDDTGDQISEKRMHFNEFTVQYWAWKNVEADYYGLCHYRRFLSFSEERYPTDDLCMVSRFFLDNGEAGRFGLLNAEKMAQVIGQYDLVLGECAQVSRAPTPIGHVQTVRQLWDAHDKLFVPQEAIEKMFSLIDEMAPQYSASAREYFSTEWHRGYNCYIMRRELFFRLCEFQFPILFELEHWLEDKSFYEDYPRIPGYVGEMLYGIFTYHITTYEKWRVKEQQLLLFQNTEKSGIGKRIKFYVCYAIEKAVRMVADIVIPLGTPRREFVKRCWYKLKN